MRAAIGELELDEVLHARAKLNTMICETVQDAALAWGLEIKRYELTDISPDKHITEAMDKQAAAERERRKQVHRWLVVKAILVDSSLAFASCRHNGITVHCICV